MRRLFVCALVLALLQIAPWVHFTTAAIALVGTNTCVSAGNDQTCTFGAGWTSGNTLIIATANTNTTAAQHSITGTVDMATPLGEINDPGVAVRFYGFCLAIDASDAGDTAFVTTTVGGGNAWVAAAEFSGTNGCTEDTMELSEADAMTPYNLSPTITTTEAGVLLFGLIKSNSVSDFCDMSCSPTEPIPSDGTDIGTLALGGYRITGAAGSYDLPFRSAVNETATMAVYAIRASAGGIKPRGLLLGVFP